MARRALLGSAVLLVMLLPTAPAHAQPPGQFTYDPRLFEALVSRLRLHPEVMERLVRVARATIPASPLQLGFEQGLALRDCSVDRDRLLFLQGRDAHYDRRIGPGSLLFAGVSMLAARAPQPVRVLFTGNPHLGPALLADGGLGAAARIRF